MSVLSPSDLARRAHDASTPVRVGGRLRVEGGRVAVFDALASCPTDLAPATAPREGSLVVVEGRPVSNLGERDPERTASNLGEGGGAPAVLHGARVVWSGAGTYGADVRRFADQGIARNLGDRSRAEEALRSYFAEEGFLEVATPAGVPCPGLDLHLDAFALHGTTEPRWLSTSPELQMKRLLVGGIPRCFQLARCFRRGEQGSRHEPEFTMLEWYRAFDDGEGILRDTESLIERVALALTGSTSLRVAGRTVEVARPFERITVAEAFLLAAHLEADEVLRLAHEDEDRFFRVLVEEVEPMLAERTAPVVLHRYPANQASLARLCADDPRWAERFEIMAGGLELSNGFVELTEPEEQRTRFERDRNQRATLGMPVYPIDERFMQGLADGMPPSAGNALGFDRLVAIGLGASRIAEVVAFPQAEL